MMTRIHIGRCTAFVQDMQRDTMGKHQAPEIAAVDVECERGAEALLSSQVPV